MTISIVSNLCQPLHCGLLILPVYCIVNLVVIALRLLRDLSLVSMATIKWICSPLPLLIDHLNFFFWKYLFVCSLFFSWFFFFFFFFFVFYLFILNCFSCSGFCHTLKWNIHGFTCVPHPDPPSHLPLHPIPLGPGALVWFFLSIDL